MDRIHTVPNGIDINCFKRFSNSELKRIELGLKLTDEVIGCVGNLRPEKNHQNVLRAFALIAAQHPHLNLVLCGDGDCRRDLEGLAKQLKVAERVLFLGYRLDTAEIMATFDIFCLPSKYEGMPISILEAWASGKPVVATDVAGIRDLIVNGENGILVSPNNPGKLAKGIMMVLKNEQLRDKIRINGSRLVSEKYGIKKMVTSYERLYRLLREF
jgi:glycosyltransferase involved in cell wall biosynthesis